jgi:hypothetical protein
MNSDRHARISERAYLLWIAEGGVHGRDEHHWHQAEREIAGEEGEAPARARRAAAPKAARAAKSTSTAKPKAAAKKSGRAKPARAAAGTTRAPRAKPAPRPRPSS